ncbi:MAG: hypothetical protein ACK5WZ_02435 [Pseudobdellovibrionaceae bacterium]
MKKTLLYLILCVVSFVASVGFAQTNLELKIQTLVDGSAITLTEGIDETGLKVVRVSLNGLVVDTVHLSGAQAGAQEETLSNLAEETQFRNLRQDYLVNAYKAFNSLQPETILASADENTTITAEIKSSNLAADEPVVAAKKHFLQNIKTKIWTPLVQAFYQMKADQKSVLMAHNEFGLAMHAQFAPSFVINKFGLGYLLGIGLDIGYNRELRKIMISFYEIHGISSGGFSVDASVGAGFGAYFRGGPDSANRVTASQSGLGRALGIATGRERRSGQYTNLNIFVASLLQEVAPPRYVNIQGQLSMGINPIPGVLMINSVANGWTFGFHNPMVFFEKVGEQYNRMSDWITAFWDQAGKNNPNITLPRAGSSGMLSCHSVL